MARCTLRRWTLYHFTRAQILIERHEFEDAKQLLQTVLEVQPDHKPAQDLLGWLETWGDLASFWTEDVSSYWEEHRKRDRAWRERLQKKLNTVEPTLAEALPLYTREALTGTAREVMPWGDWSALRKAQLIDAIIEALKDRANLKRIVERLTSEEQEALRTILDRGGAMPWDDFEARYGNDLDASRYWQWHTPETVMGRLRLHGLLVEATVDDVLYVTVPMELRESLRV